MNVLTHQNLEMVIFESIPADNQKLKRIEIINLWMNDSSNIILWLMNEKQFNDKANINKNNDLNL